MLLTVRIKKWKEKKNNSWDFCRRSMDTLRKKPRRNIRGSSAAIGSPLQVRKVNEIEIMTRMFNKGK